MIYVAIALMVAASAVWVYLDASRHGIGKEPGRRALFNMSAGGWGAATLLFWILAFPAYLVKRQALLERAKTDPIFSGARVVKAGLVGLGGGVLVLMTFLGASFSLPRCDATETSATVEQIFNNLSAFKEAKRKFVMLDGVKEQKFDSETQHRTCAATMVTSDGSYSVDYELQWADRRNGQFEVRAQLGAQRPR